MAEVTLTLKGDNKDLIRSLDEVQKKQQQVHDTAQRGHKEELGRIEELRLTIQKLTDARDKSTDITKIEAYNKRIKEEKEDLKELETAGVRSMENIGKSTTGLIGKFSSLIGKISLVGTAIALVTKFARDLVSALKDTETGFKLVNEFAIKYRQTLYEIATGTTRSQEVIRRTIELERLSNEIHKERNIILKKTTDLQLQYEEHRTNAAREEIGSKTRLDELNAALDDHNTKVALEVSLLQKQFEYATIDLQNRPKSQKAIEAEANAYAALVRAQADAHRESLRIEREKTAEQKRQRDAMFQRYFDEIEEQNRANDKKLKDQEDFNNLSKQLIDDLDKANIESLTGVDKLKAQRDYELKALDQFKSHMQSLGTLTPEQEQMFIMLGEKVWAAFYRGLDEETKTTAELYDKWLQSHFGDVIDYVHKQNQELEKELRWLFGKIDELNAAEDKKRQDNKEKLLSAANEIVGSIEYVYQKKVDDAQRSRELYDTQIRELQNSIEIELRLKEAGYASNLSAKQAELAQLQAARDAALREEEKALQKQRQAELIIQELSLATSAAKLIKESIDEGGLYGLILAAAEIATMFVMFDQYKQQAKSSTRLAEGGSGTDTGIVTGRSHAAGGERFLSQVEVERGEAWGVLSIPATQKYGKIFHEMVSSFNRGEIPTVVPAPTVNNSVMVDNKGPNSRLDALIRENRKLNEKLSKESVQDLGDSRIIRKNDNIRIVHR